MYGELSAQSQTLVEQGRQYFVPNYKPKGVVLDHGKGARLWDLDGNEYIDLGTGISVNSLGHQDPELVDALLTQGQKLWHTSNIYFNEPSIRLAAELVAGAPFAAKAFFCNSGAESNEAAIKLARRFAANNGKSPEEREIITFYGGFHGRTLATVTATAQPKYHEGFEPVPGGFVYCNFNDFDAVAGKVSDKTCAIMVEPIQGEGGVNPAQPGFLRHLRELCDKHGALLICDEIQSGMSRSGKLFTHYWEEEGGVVPDVVTMAKALGGGLPIGAMLASAKVAEALPFGSHGSTFGGNPVASSVARVMWRRVQEPKLLANVQQQGERLLAALQSINDELGIFGEIRGRGLIIGAQLKDAWKGKAGEFGDYCMQQGALILQAGPDVLRFLPPLNITDEELDTGMQRVTAALKAACSK
jgi:acetylornithine/N-succinyldiaminopimelate aminotransferase